MGEGATTTAARGGDPNLKTLDPEDCVQTISYCHDTYRVTTADGKTHAFWERNLRLKTDSSGNGPQKGAPALIGAGMMGDRSDIIFAAPEVLERAARKASAYSGSIELRQMDVCALEFADSTFDLPRRAPGGRRGAATEVLKAGGRSYIRTDVGITTTAHQALSSLLYRQRPLTAARERSQM